MNKPIKGTNVNILKNESGIISDKKLIAENFNEHFIKLGPEMYVDEIEFDGEAATIEKIVDLVFTEMIHDKMQQLEKEEFAKQDQTDGNQWSRFNKCSEVLDHEGRWITYAEQALSLLNHEVM